MRENTFGTTEAATVMAAILNEMGDKKVSKNVTSYWSNYSHGISQICTMTDKSIARSLLMLWRSAAEERARQFGGKVGTFLCNMIVCKYRQALDSIL